MVRYIVLRLALFVPTLLIASIVIFAILRVLPGDVVDVVLGGSGEVAHDPIQVQRVREEFGLDEPVVAQYGSWLWSMATGDFGGRSFVNREPISSLVARQLPVTLQLAVYTMVLAAMVAIPGWDSWRGEAGAVDGFPGAVVRDRRAGRAEFLPGAIGVDCAGVVVWVVSTRHL